jgi:hypothetical protein
VCSAALVEIGGDISGYVAAKMDDVLARTGSKEDACGAIIWSN